MRSMSIRAKLVFGFGVLVTITPVQGGAAYRGMLIVDNSASEIERQTVAAAWRRVFSLWRSSKIA
jgi:CHASE3 domain sensor protein